MSEELLNDIAFKIRKLEIEIKEECEEYSKYALKNDKGYIYYSSELEAINIRRDRDVKALERSFEVKKQVIIAKADALREQYRSKCEFLEKFHKKPSNKNFLKKQSKLSLLKELMNPKTIHKEEV